MPSSRIPSLSDNLLRTLNGDELDESVALLIRRADEGRLSQTQVTVNLMKCAVGAGSFSVPYAFMTAGLGAGIFGGILLGVLAAYTIILLVRVEKRLVALSGSSKRLTYPEVVATTFPSSQGEFNIHEYVVYVNIILTCVGSCMAYVIFIIETFPQVVPSIAEWEVAVGILPILVALALLRTFSVLSFTSILGDIAIVLGFTGTLMNGFETEHSGSIVYLDWSHVAQTFASLSFLYMAHQAVLPMSQSLVHDLAQPKRFEAVIRVAFSIITIINIAFGTLAYLAFRTDTQGNVVLSLESGNIVTMLVQTFLCVDLLFTAPIFLAVGRELIEKSVMSFETTFSTNYPESTRNILRTCIVLFIIGASFLCHMYAENAFYDVVSLVGGICGFTLGFIYPPIMYIKTFGAELSRLEVNACRCIVALGFLSLISSTVFTVLSFD